MKVDRYGVSITTNASGDFTRIIQSTEGLLYQIKLDIGSLISTTDITLTEVSTGDILYAQTNNTTSFNKYPRILQSSNTDGTILTTHDYILVQGNLKLTIAQGGNTTKGDLRILVVR